MSKSEIFDMFYGISQVSRVGGGKPKAKMCRRTVTFDKIEVMKLKIIDDVELKYYFNKLQTRQKDLAPPPKPQ